MAGAVRCVASSSWTRSRESNHNSSTRFVKGFKVSCVLHPSSSSVSDPYKTLRIEHGASESDVKKAFRKLALQYHPDVCRGGNSGNKFQQIYEAYEILMSRIQEQSNPTNQTEIYDDETADEDDQEWDLWEEWMGWEGAGIRDYSSHINPYI